MDFNTTNNATNMPPAPQFTPLAHTIAQGLRARPRAIAIRFGGASISNAMLLQRVLELHALLASNNIGEGTRVGVCLERGPDTLALMLALWMRRAVYVPLDHALPRERLFNMCESARIAIVVTEAAVALKVERLPSALLLLGGEVEIRQISALAGGAEGESGAADLAYILFTSGSTGIPKGVQITQGNLSALFGAMMSLLKLEPETRVLACASFSFDISFFELLAPLLCGGTLVMADAVACESPLELLKLVAEERVAVIQATPTHWQLLNALRWATPIRIALATGEALSRDTAAEILRHAEVLWNLYGPTECTIWSSAHRVCADDLSDTAPAIVSIGTALSGYELQLEASQGAEALLGSELVIGGCGVGAGYCEAPQPSAFERRPGGSVYHSGDLCRYDEHRRLHYLGRSDNQAKHNGYRIELDEIALALRQHMCVRDAVCIVRPASDGMPSLLFACVSLRPGLPNRNKAALNAWLAPMLPHWMLPQRYFFLEKLPLSTNGKLDRSALLALTGPASRPHSDASLETQVARVFCEVLDLESIGPCDSFLDAGGTSMLAATLVLTLNERLGANITLRQALATPPTVSGIVQLLRQATAASVPI